MCQASNYLSNYYCKIDILQTTNTLTIAATSFKALYIIPNLNKLSHKYRKPPHPVALSLASVKAVLERHINK